MRDRLLHQLLKVFSYSILPSYTSLITELVGSASRSLNDSNGIVYFNLIFSDCQDFWKLFIPNWDPKEDKLWIRKINIKEVPNEPCPSEVDYAIQDVKGLVSTGFGRIVSNHLIKHPALIPSFLKTGFNMVQRFNDGARLEPINKAIHYQSFIEILPVVDMEFAFNASSDTFPKQALAMQEVVQECKRLYKELKFPLSVAMEMRWIADSDCLVCPARAVQNENPGKGMIYRFRQA